MHANTLNTSRLPSVRIDVLSNLEIKVTRDLFKLNYGFEVPFLGFIEKIFMILWEAKGYIKVLAVALFFLHLF